MPHTACSPYISPSCFLFEVCGLNVNRELVKAKKLDPELVQEFEGYLCARGKESNAPDATAKPPMKKAKTPAKTPAKAATDAAPKAAAPAPPKPKHPPIEMQKATVAAARALSENGRSRLLELEGLESAITYEPGHVLMLEAEHQPTGAAKGPYTVVRADTKAKKVLSSLRNPFLPYVAHPFSPYPRI